MEQLHILWTTGDPVTAKNMVFMYARNALRFKWGWEKVHMFIWGASTQLLVNDASIQAELRAFLELGGTVSVCKKCAENLEVVSKVKDMETWGELKVYYVGDAFTKVLKKNEKLITI